MVNEEGMYLGIIGIGNIGSSLCKGLSISENIIKAYDRNEYKNQKVKKYKNVCIVENEKEVIDSSDILILCIRTNQVLEWIKNNSSILNKKTLILVQSGINVLDIKNTGLENTTNVIRLISNVNVSEGLGHTVILKNDCKEFNTVQSVFSSIGRVIIVNTEKQLNEISLITGCTPAIGAMLLQGVNSGYPDDHLALISEVLGNTMKTIIASNNTPKDYAKKTYSEGGIFEKCIESIDGNSEFQNILKNWLNPLKKSLE